MRHEWNECSLKPHFSGKPEKPGNLPGFTRITNSGNLQNWETSTFSSAHNMGQCLKTGSIISGSDQSVISGVFGSWNFF